MTYLCGMETINNAMEVLQGGAIATQNIENQLFEVLDYRPEGFELDGMTYDKPEATHVYRKDTGQFLGAIGTTYQSIQPIEFLNSIVNSVQGCNLDLDLSKLEYMELKGGRMIEFKIPTDVVTFKNRAKKQEEIPLFINFFTGFAGYGSTEIGLYSKRLVCSNGMRIIESEIELKAKHTLNMNAKALAWCDELYKVVAHAQAQGSLWKQLDKIDVSDEAIQMFKHKLLGIKDVQEISTRKKNQLENLNESIEIEMSRTGKSAFGLLQGATYYSNHLSKSTIDEDYLMLGTGHKINLKAQELIYTSLDAYNSRK